MLALFERLGHSIALTLWGLYPTPHQGQAYTLTGPAALSHADVAQTLSELLGEPLRYCALDEQAARQAMLTSGLSEQRAERLLGFYRLVRGGFCAPVSDAVERVLGRPARSFAAFAEAHRSCWLAPG